VEPGGVAPRVATEQPERARVGAQQSEQRPERRGLACTVGAEEPVHLAGPDREVQPVEGPDPAEGLHCVVHLDREALVRVHTTTLDLTFTNS
jgi:hypothetical protein